MEAMVVMAIMEDRNTTQLDELERYLIEKSIPYERIDNEDVPIDDEHPYFLVQLERHQICVPNAEEREWDAICHRGSYGAEDGLLEIMGTIVRGDYPVEGWLTAKEVIQRFEGNGDKP